MSIFVDTSGILALVTADDRFHPAAQSTWREWATQRPRMVTSNYVVLETVALIQRRMGLDAIRSLQENLLSVIQVKWITPQIHRRAVTALLTANRRQLSLVDCTSFELMRDLGLSRVFSFDHHFSQQGFTRLP